MVLSGFKAARHAVSTLWQVVRLMIKTCCRRSRTLLGQEAVELPRNFSLRVLSRTRCKAPDSKGRWDVNYVLMAVGFLHSIMNSNVTPLPPLRLRARRLTIQKAQDVDRTRRDFEYFRRPATKAALTALLFVYAKLNPGVRYVQGRAAQVHRKGLD